MNTKRFLVEFDGSRFLRHGVELQAKVTTDHASHKVRMHINLATWEVLPQALWIDGTRTYTIHQKSHVLALFSQAQRDVVAAIDAYLIEHNYPTRDKLREEKWDVWMDLSANHHVDEFRVDHWEQL